MLNAGITDCMALCKWTPIVFVWEFIFCLIQYLQPTVNTLLFPGYPYKYLHRLMLLKAFCKLELVAAIIVQSDNCMGAGIVAELVLLSCSSAV